MVSGAVLPLKITVQDHSPLEVDFTILDSEGHVLGPDQGGVFRWMGEGWEYQAPATAGNLHLTLRVSTRGAAPASDESKITVLGLAPAAAEGKNQAVPIVPAEAAGNAPGAGVLSQVLPFPGVVMKEVLSYLAEDEGLIRTERFPFMDLQTGGRFPDASGHGPGPEVPEDERGLPVMNVPSPMRSRTVGYGLPCDFPLLPGRGEGSSLCSFLDLYPASGAGMTRLEMGNASMGMVRLLGNVRSFTVEDLRWDGKAWQSRVWRQPVTVRGLCPMAGAVNQPGVVDGRGHQARCRTILGLALADRLEGLAPAREERGTHVSYYRAFVTPPREGVVFTEEGSHAVRIAGLDGQVFTLCGDALVGGFKDGPGKAALFNKPGRVAVGPAIRPVENPHGGGPRDFHAFAYVADVGNHCIREVDLATGQVHTFALAGGASLANPQGLCVATDSLVVADQGDRLVKRIDPRGQVKILAGNRPGGYRFTQLKAIARMPEVMGAFYVLDGNALCTLDRKGRVEVLAGVVDKPGFADLRAAQPGLPCLDQPTDLACSRGLVYIAERSALRCYNPVTRTLETLAGNPGSEVQRWGLLRDGLAEWPRNSQDYATLVDTRALAAGLGGALVVGTGDCLGIVDGLPAAEQAGGDPSIQVRPPAGPAAAGSPLPLRFTVSPGAGRAQGVLRPGATTLVPGGGGAPEPGLDLRGTAYDFEYWITCTNNATEVPLRGQGRFGVPVTVPLTGLVQGENTVRIRCVTAAGFSTASRLTLSAAGPG